MHLAATRQSSVYDGDVAGDVGGQRIAQLENGNAYAELWNDGDSRMLVIRGTDGDLWDWVSNFNCRPVLGLHAGFATYAKLVIEALEREGLHHLCDKPIYLVGHSLGGAAATLLPHLSQQFTFAECVITFGSPPVFWNDTPPSYITDAYHVRFETDIVPDVPLQFGQWCFAKWRHPKTALTYWFDGKSKPVVPGKNHEMYRRIRRYVDWFNAAYVRGGSFLDDVKYSHSRHRYAKLFPLEVVV